MKSSKTTRANLDSSTTLLEVIGRPLMAITKVGQGSFSKVILCQGKISIHEELSLVSKIAY